ncbi:MAG: HD domain-containing protein, partial [bacterium]|nr:HD domain-containing protein [bacterium]
MPRASESRGSIFSQRLDRAVFASYFLGGVLPVGGLGWVIHYYVLPGADTLATAAWIAGLLCMGLLSLSVYFVLRNVTGRALARMDADNRRLNVLLQASSDLAAESHSDGVLEKVAAHASGILDGSLPVLLYADRADKELELSGPGAALLEEHVDEARRVAEDAIASGQSTPSASGMLAVPFGSEGAGRGAVLVPPTIDHETLDAVATLSCMAGTAVDRGDLADAQRNFFAHVTDLLVTALDSHVVGRDGHATAVARLSNSLGRALHLDATRLERLHFASLLHDIGMLKIPPEHHQEARAFRAHPLFGARMLAGIRLWEPLAPIVQCHHEWIDGSGYPEGRMGDSIPLEARVIAVADAMDAMRRESPTGPGKSLPEIVEELEAGR